MKKLERFDELYGDDFEGGFRDKIKSYILDMLDSLVIEEEVSCKEELSGRGHTGGRENCWSCATDQAVQSQNKKIEELKNLIQ